MSRLNRSIRNMASNLFGWVIPVALNMVAVPLLIQKLGPDAYGLSNLVMVLVGYFSIMDLGMDIAGIKLLAEYQAMKDNESISRLMSTKLVLYVSMGLIGTAIVLLMSNMLATRFFTIPIAFRPEAIIVFRLAAFSVITNMIISWASVAPQGMQRYDVLNGISVATSIVSTASGLIAVYAGYGVVGFVLVRILTNMLAAVASTVMAYKLLPTMRLKFAIDMQMLRQIFGITVYGLVIKIAGMMAGSIDRTLIGVWIGTTAVAAYSVPFLVTTYLNQLALRLMNFIFPMASEMLQLGKMDEMRAIFIKASKFAVILTTLATLPCAALADRILTLWVGAKMAAMSTTPFRFLLIGCYLSSMVTLFSHLMVGIGYVREWTLLFLLRTAVLVGLCVILIKSMGINGAGIAVAITGLVDIAIGAYCLRAYIKVAVVRFFREYVMPVGLGLALSALVLLARPHVNSWVSLIGALVAYVLLYVCLAFCTGVFGKTEKELIGRVRGDLMSRRAAGRK